MEIFESAAEELFDPDARVEHLGGGFSWAEGPVWNFEEDYLTFSDVIGNAMHRYDDSGGVQSLPPAEQLLERPYEGHRRTPGLLRAPDPPPHEGDRGQCRGDRGWLRG